MLLSDGTISRTPWVHTHISLNGQEGVQSWQVACGCSFTFPLNSRCVRKDLHYCLVAEMDKVGCSREVLSLEQPYPDSHWKPLIWSTNNYHSDKVPTSAWNKTFLSVFNSREPGWGMAIHRPIQIAISRSPTSGRQGTGDAGIGRNSS